MVMAGHGKWRFAVDRGGTFTDVIGLTPDGGVRTAKLLSQSAAYGDAALEGIRRLLGVATDAPLPAERVAWIRLGTTVATNALLERRGAPTGLLITRGFRDLLEIGTQQRPELFQLAIRKPELLYTEVAEVTERMDAEGVPLQPLDRAGVRAALQGFRERGIASVAIVFLHAWRNPAHEEQAAQEARAMGFEQVSSSHATLSVIQAVGRGRTTLVDAYLTPVLKRYADRVRRHTGAIPLHFMSSAGGLLAPRGFTGKDAILSGPAGGVVGVAAVAGLTGDAEVIGFDMGGTSTDVCRFDGTLERVLEVETAGVRYQAPMLHVETVASGGGSLLHFDGRKLTVGPDSAGADPGPACYGLGGPAAITDANLVLGRIVPEFFPRVFGPGRNAPLDPAASRARLQAIAHRIQAEQGRTMSVEELALGFVRIANETMGRPVKALSVARGFDLRRHALICFGGAGAQHACGIAATLGIARVRIHPLAGLLSAYGIARAAHRRTRVETRLDPVSAATLAAAQEHGREVAALLEQELRGELGLPAEAPFQRLLEVDLRTPGTDTPLTIPFDPAPAVLLARFREHHQRHFGFLPGDPAVELVNLRVEVVELGAEGEPGAAGEAAAPAADDGAVPPPVARQPVWFQPDAPHDTPVYRRAALRPGAAIPGPALVVEAHSTVVVEPGFDLTMDAHGILTLHLRQVTREALSTRCDPVTLELFNHRFMGIAGQMGETLARTAHSVNIKERHDFSCAIFDRQGRLIANAPHIPVHLGAMGETVAGLLAQRGADMRPGDVYVCNDPHRGGSHLPDVTVMSPLFRGEELKFLVASRGHHADIGGTVPGSMPPSATRLEEEGVVLSNLLAVREGAFQEAALRRALGAGPWPARNPGERLSDLRAQIAANHTGMRELARLCDLYGDPVVAAYMDHMRDNAAQSLAEALEGLLAGRERWRGHYADALDDGTPVVVTVTVARDADGRPRAEVDFNGTGGPHPGNLNAPPAVVRAAVLYVFRALIPRDIPLNDGCLELIRIHLPRPSLLHPPPGAAVAAGNVETSQRVVDVLLGALGVAAASQGTMNNFLFGSPDGSGSQYYETIAGGAGGMPECPGASGVQVHMTNTRITDPEVLEHRFPQLRLERFALRRGSGGRGRWPGGDGVVRGVRFLAPTAVTIVSERRVGRPFGLAGGEPGQPGENRLWRAGAEQPEPLPGRYQGVLAAGDLLEIHTPGGGGYGTPPPAADEDAPEGPGAGERQG